MKRLPQQAATVAVRRVGASVEVCLIRKKTSKRWGIPKGLVESGDTHEETALKEAAEEAGISGRLIGDPVGIYEYEKWDTRFSVTVYLMEVLEEHETWEEADRRQRRWTSWEKATSLLTDHPARPLLERARKRVDGTQRVRKRSTP